MARLFRRQIYRGFTVVEVLVVAALITGMAAWLFPVSTTIQSRRVLEAVTDEVVQALREAQANAALGAHGRRWGVYVDLGVGGANPRFVLFAGPSFASRDTGLDLVHPLPGALSWGSVNLAGGNEVVFAPVTGAALNPGSLQLRHTNGESLTINVNAAGTVDIP